VEAVPVGDSTIGVPGLGLGALKGFSALLKDGVAIVLREVRHVRGRLCRSFSDGRTAMGNRFESMGCRKEFESVAKMICCCN
jgi:hypothetical protein